MRSCARFSGISRSLYWFYKAAMMQMTVPAATDLTAVPMIAGAIPLIDVAGHLGGDAASSRKAATQLRWAFENVGFYYLAGHGVPPSLIDRTYEAAARFHAQPMAKKPESPSGEARAVA
jgi:hypothetical protein